MRKVYSTYNEIQRGGNNKYQNKKITVEGKTFDSIKEYRRFCQLEIMEKAGEISDLKCQVKFVLIPAQREETGEVYTKGKNKGQPKLGKVIEKECAYIADFTYKQDGKLVVEDVKGYRDAKSAGYAKFIIKRKMMLYFYNIRVQEF